jgi:hypothetical protein
MPAFFYALALPQGRSFSNPATTDSLTPDETPTGLSSHCRACLPQSRPEKTEIPVCIGVAAKPRLIFPWHAFCSSVGSSAVDPREQDMSETTNHPANEAVRVSLVSDKAGADSVAVELASGEVVLMTPAQARSLATSLITAVNRAEVKASLRVSTNLWRRGDEAEVNFSSVRG